ncbi:methyltransferase [Candidatus Epulonipiscium fishelsonii]|nr:methyltransferase [Epulopiscium sp. SCG-C06WGA-EpuloA1]
MNYAEINSKVIDSWVKDGWEWGKPINLDTYKNALNGNWNVFLTPTKPVPHEWFGNLKGKKILGLASGGAQQMPIFVAAGADATVLDYSDAQLKSEEDFANLAGYTVTKENTRHSSTLPNINIIKADMTQRLPFSDESFEIIFHPVSNCYVEDVYSIWKECYRILKKGGILLSGLDNGINFIVDMDEDETKITQKLPFNPMNDIELYEKSIKNNWGIQFSHTIEEQIGGQLKAGFKLADIYSDTNGLGYLHDLNIATFYATKSIK